MLWVFQYLSQVSPYLSLHLALPTAAAFGDALIREIFPDGEREPWTLTVLCASRGSVQATKMLKRFMNRSSYVHASKGITMYQMKHHRPFFSRLKLFGTGFVICTASHQFLTNLHTVPISGRTQVVVLSREDEHALGRENFERTLNESDIVDTGPEFSRVLNVARYVAPGNHELI